MEEKKKIICAFCGKEDDSAIMIESLEGGIYICEDCLQQGKDAVDEIKEEDKIKEIKSEVKNIMKPTEVYNYLNDYVVGQEKAKKVLSVAVYNHYKTLKYKENENAKIELQKSNVLLLGPTGVGKTYLVQTLAKMLDVPLAIQDATSLTEAGYVGDDVENCIRKLIEAADGDIERAEKGIIYIDEIDKLSRKGENPSITRDVSGEGVQQALLKIIEGDVIDVPIKGGRKHPMQEGYKIDTSNILFICGGSFEGIDKIVEKRLNKDNKSIGFGAKKKEAKERQLGELYKEIKSEDIKKFGLLPEFLGRLPVICPLHELDKKALVSILTEPKNAITKQYQELFAMDGIELLFDNDALISIANKAIETKTGARSLRSIIEENLLEYMFDYPNDSTIRQVIITKDCILKGNAPKVIKEKIS